MANEDNAPVYMTAANVAEFTGYTVDTILRYWKKGYLNGYHPYGRRPVLFKKNEVIAYFNGR